MLRCQFYDPVPTFGCLDDAAYGRDIKQKARHYTVGGDHEILDQLRSAVLFLPGDAHHLLALKNRL